jgi:hypothetical protein
MRLSSDEDQMPTDRAFVPGPRRVARCVQHPAAGWRGGVPAGIAVAIGGHSPQS